MFKVGDKVKINPEHLAYFEQKHANSPLTFVKPDINETYVIVGCGLVSGFDDKQLLTLKTPCGAYLLPACYSMRLIKCPKNPPRITVHAPRVFMLRGARHGRA